MPVSVTSCIICQKTVPHNKSIKCMVCSQISHYKCNFLNSVDFQVLKNNNKNWQCLDCSRKIFPFTELNNYKFNDVANNSPYFSISDNKLCFSPPSNLTSLYNNFNDLTFEINENPENIINCKYYDISEMNSLTQSISDSSLKLFHLNISSLSKHIDSLEQLLATSHIDFDIVAISESRILNDCSTSHLNLTNYSLDYCCSEASAGGTAIYIKNSISYKSRPDLKIYKSRELESNFIEIINPNKTNFIIGCIYRHPNMDLNEFNEIFLNDLLDRLSKENKKVFLLGDFNVDLLKYDNHILTNEFLDSLSSNLFLPNIILPTRITNSSKTLIDNIFSNQLSNDIISGNLTVSISDHLPQFCIFPEILSNSPSPKSNIYERDWKNFDQSEFILDYFSFDWNLIIALGKQDVNTSFENFLNMFNVLLDKYAPFKKVNKYKLKLKSKPWITQAIAKSIETKNKFFKKYIKTKDNDLKKVFHDRYKIHRNLLSTLIKQSKKDYYNNFFSKNIGDLKNTWKGIKSIISNSNTASNAPNCISFNNSILTNPKQIANTFNNYFCSIAQNIQSNIKYSFRNFRFFLGNVHEKSFFVSPTDFMEVNDIISTMNSNKSQGPNGIPTKILKLLKEDISYTLANLFNLSFSSGVFPSILKTAKVIPVHKKLSKLECSNYRPISILSNLDKILERLMYNRLYKFIEDNDIFYSLQFGFRKKLSTSYALLNLTENIQQEIDKGRFGCGIFIDLQKAFDTVDHKILISKLEHYGIRGLSNHWFSSYLSERKQYVSINGYNSDLKSIQCGVPQGSILGPLLFLIYINDLHSSIKFSKTHHFADDTNLLFFSNSIKTLNKSINYDLKHLVHWLNANKISLNIGKTELVLFKPSKKKLDNDLKIKLNGKRLYPTSSVKYLGINIDSNLNWKEHMNAIVIKLNRANSILSKLRHFVQSSTLKSIYHAIFDSHFNYASIVWAQGVNFQNRLFLLQKKAIRIMSFSDRIAHTDPLFYNSKIIKLPDKILIENCYFISKYFFNLLPPLFHDWFDFSSTFHSHNLRSSDLGILKIPKFHTKHHGRLSFKINAIYTWNKLQTQLKDYQLYKIIPNKLKNVLTNYYLSNYV